MASTPREMVEISGERGSLLEKSKGRCVDLEVKMPNWWPFGDAQQRSRVICLKSSKEDRTQSIILGSIRTYILIKVKSLIKLLSIGILRKKKRNWKLDPQNKIFKQRQWTVSLKGFLEGRQSTKSYKPTTQSLPRDNKKNKTIQRNQWRIFKSLYIIWKDKNAK